MGDNKLSFLKVWELFINWVENLGFNLKKDIYLCAYNGYDFDFRVMIHELRREGYEIQQNFKLVDPCFDIAKWDKKPRTLDLAFKEL